MSLDFSPINFSFPELLQRGVLEGFPELLQCSEVSTACVVKCPPFQPELRQSQDLLLATATGQINSWEPFWCIWEFLDL